MPRNRPQQQNNNEAFQFDGGQAGGGGCCSFKCQMIAIGILLIVDFVFKCWNFTGIVMNPYFDSIYGIVYAVFLIVFVVAVVFISIYLCSEDSPKSRSYAPYAFLLGGIANIGVALWIVVYVSVIYEDDYIKTPRSSDPDDAPRKESKGSYNVWNSLFSFINGGLYIWLFFTTKAWVEENENNEAATNE